MYRPKNYLKKQQTTRYYNVKKYNKETTIKFKILSIVFFCFCELVLVAFRLIW